MKPAEQMQDVLAEEGEQAAAQEGGARDTEATDEGLDCQEPLCPWCRGQALQLLRQAQDGELGLELVLPSPHQFLLVQEVDL